MKSSKSFGEEDKVFWHKSIGFKVFLYFLIPVILIIFIGVASYKQAAGAITEKYMESALEGVKMSGEYIGFGLSGVKSIALECTSNDDIKKYYLGVYFNTRSLQQESASKLNSIEKLLWTKQSTNNFIQNIHILSEEYGMITTEEKKQSKLKVTKNIYTE